MPGEDEPAGLRAVLGGEPRFRGIRHERVLRGEERVHGGDRERLVDEARGREEAGPGERVPAFEDRPLDLGVAEGRWLLGQEDADDGLGGLRRSGGKGERDGQGCRAKRSDVIPSSRGTRPLHCIPRRSMMHGAASGIFRAGVGRWVVPKCPHGWRSARRCSG